MVVQSRHAEITTELHVVVDFWFRLMLVLRHQILYLSNLYSTYIKALLSSRFYNLILSGDTIASPRRLLE
jgi:hypothetical protein